MSINFRFFDFQLNFVGDFIGICSQNIDQCDFITFFIRSNRIMQGYIFAGFLEGPQVHENLVLDATGSESGQFGPFVRGIGFDRLDQADRADRDQIFQVFTGVVELFEVVNKVRYFFLLDTTYQKVQRM